MSWSISPPIENMAAQDAICLLDDMILPDGIRDYIKDGIAGLEAYYNDEQVPVTITGHGHVCHGKGSYEVTTATIEVKKGEAIQAEEKS
jgi:ribosome-associated translation inhibitor RaiA